MKMLLANAAAGVLLLGQPLAVHASALSDWVDQVNTRIDRVAVAPASNASGTTEIEFRRGPDGRPTEIKVVSGESSLSAAVRRSLNSIGVLPPLPARYDPHTKVLLRMIVGDGTDMTAWHRAVREMHVDGSLRNEQLAARHEGNAQLALAGVH